MASVSVRAGAEAAEHEAVHNVAPSRAKAVY